MIEAIAVTLQDEIAAHSFDELTGERLLACRAIASWEANHAFSAPGIMAAGATPRLRSRAVCQWLVGC